MKPVALITRESIEKSLKGTYLFEDAKELSAVLFYLRQYPVKSYLEFYAQSGSRARMVSKVLGPSKMVIVDPATSSVFQQCFRKTVAKIPNIAHVHVEPLEYRNRKLIALALDGGADLIYIDTFGKTPTEVESLFYTALFHSSVDGIIVVNGIERCFEVWSELVKGYKYFNVMNSKKVNAGIGVVKL